MANIAILIIIVEIIPKGNSVGVLKNRENRNFYRVALIYGMITCTSFNFAPSPLYYNLLISEDEARWTIFQCSKNSAPGHYQIPTIFLQKRHPNPISFFTYLLNRKFQSSTFPTIWKLAIIIPILKPYKAGSLPLSYRSISLLCTLSKILEKILNKRLI